MARSLRIDAAEGLHHITSRGNDGSSVFVDERDRIEFLRVMEEVSVRFGWRWLTYCLMRTHYHLVPDVPAGTIVPGMRHLNGVYAIRFNARHGRSGHLFGGRYFARPISDERELQAVVRYVALNPVTAGICEAAEEWRWGGHRALLGAGGDPVLNPELLLLRLADTLEAGRSRYKALISETEAADKPAAGADAENPELHPALRALARDPSDELMTRAHVDHGIPVRVIADVVGCAPSTVSRRVRRYVSRRADSAARVA